MTDRTMSAQPTDEYTEIFSKDCNTCKHYNDVLNIYCYNCTRFHIVKKGDLYEAR